MSPILGIFSSAVVPVSGAFESIATANGSGSSATITFSSIPGTYQHLQIRFIGKYSTNVLGNAQVRIRVNGDTNNSYTTHYTNGSGAGTTNYGGSGLPGIQSISYIPGSHSSLANMFGIGIIDIHDYTSTVKKKTIRMFYGVDTNRTATPTGVVGFLSGANNAVAISSAITSIEIATVSGNWTTTSQFALYGIKGA